MENINLDELRGAFQQYYDREMNLFFSGSEEIFKSVLYSTLDGGKRIRPLLVLSMSSMCKGSLEESLIIGSCIEMIHTFSLIHDDLPAMDDDDYRRNKLSNHKKFGEATAILAGDALLNESIRFFLLKMSELPLNDFNRIHRILIHILDSSGIRGMMLGQALDIAKTSLEDKALEDEVINIHQKKTGKLIQASIISGAFTNSHLMDEMGTYFDIVKLGRDLGLCFQIMDDLYGELASFNKTGKTPKKDNMLGKMTYPRAVGLDRSKKKVEQLLSNAENIIDKIVQKHKFDKNNAMLNIVEIFHQRLDSI